MPYRSFFDDLPYKLTEAGPIQTFAWYSLAGVVIMGCVLLMIPPRSDRRISLVDTFAACLHVQMLIFILCVPLSLAAAVYIGDYNRSYVFDAFFATLSVIFDFTIGGALLVSVAKRHKTPPTIEWLPVASILVTVLSLFAVWVTRIAAMVPFE